MGKVSEVRGCALTNPENKSLVYNGKRREEKKIEKKFDCTQRASFNLDENMECMSLRAMCELLNISRRSIQCYEKAGLMTPTTKNKYGHLLYDESAFHRAEMIRFLQQLGFKLREVKEIIDAPDDVIKEALEKRVDELEHEKVKMDQIMQEARDYIEKLS